MTIILWTQSELVAARRLYQNAGFALVAQEKHQSWGRDDPVAETWELNLQPLPTRITSQPPRLLTKFFNNSQKKSCICGNFP
jgi:hypothetical protein